MFYLPILIHLKKKFEIDSLSSAISLKCSSPTTGLFKNVVREKRLIAIMQSQRVGNRPIRTFPDSVKIAAITRVRGSESKASVPRDMNIPESTLRGWCKSEEEIRNQNYAANWESSDESKNKSEANTLEDEFEEEDEPEPGNNDIVLSVHLGDLLGCHIHTNQLSDIEFEENGPTRIIAKNQSSCHMQVPAEGVVYVISDPDSFDDIFQVGSDSDSGYGARSQPSSLVTSNS